MRKLIRYIAILIFLCLLVIFVLPFFTGLWIQRQYPQIIKKFSATQGVTIKELSYHRQWFRSDITMQMSFNTKWFKSENLVVKAVLYHGPVIFSKNFKDHYQITFAAALIKNTLDVAKNYLQAHTIWSFTNHLTTRFFTPQFTLENPQRQQVVFSNLQGHFSYQPNTQHVKAALKFYKANFNLPINNSAKMQQITVTNLATHGDFSNEGVLWYGKRDITIDQVTVQTDSGETYLLKNLSAKTEQTKQQKNTQIKFQFAAELLHAPNVQWGPLQVDVSLNDLNTQDLQNFVRHALSMKEMNRGQQFVMLYQPAMELAGKGLSVQLNKFYLRTPQGSVDVSAYLNVKPQVGPPSLPGLLTSMESHADLQIPKTLLLQQLTQMYEKEDVASRSNQQITASDLAKQQVQHWIDTQMLKANGDLLAMQIKFSQGKLFINEKPFGQKNTM